MSEPAAPADAAPKSLAWPWVRAVATSLIAALSPAVWVVETQSCSSDAVPRDITGIEAARAIEVEPFDAVWMILLAVLMLAAPWLAGTVRTIGQRLAVHVAGALAAAFTAMMVVFVVAFTLFSARVIRPAGYLAMLAGVAPLIDGIMRVVLGAIELRRARRAARAAPAPPRDPGS